MKGTIVDHSRDRMLSIIQDLKLKGAEAVILGCTEIPMLIKQEHCDIPVIDTTDIHARSAVKYVLGT